MVTSRQVGEGERYMQKLIRVIAIYHLIMCLSHDKHPFYSPKIIIPQVTLAYIVCLGWMAEFVWLCWLGTYLELSASLT